MYLVSSRSRLYRLFGVMVIFAVLTGCAYNKAVNNLSPEEQTTFRTYSKVLHRKQALAYLSKPNTAERQSYLREIGTLQRFEALDPQDREAISNGYIRKGMSAEALNFLWGLPRYTTGHTGKWERWVYNGQIIDLLENGNRASDAGSSVEVLFVDGQVEWWFEGVPESNDDPGDSFQRSSRR